MVFTSYSIPNQFNWQALRKLIFLMSIMGWWSHLLLELGTGSFLVVEHLVFSDKAKVSVLLLSCEKISFWVESLDFCELLGVPLCVDWRYLFGISSWFALSILFPDELSRVLALM